MRGEWGYPGCVNKLYQRDKVREPIRWSLYESFDAGQTFKLDFLVRDERALLGFIQ